MKEKEMLNYLLPGLKVIYTKKREEQMVKQVSMNMLECVFWKHE